MRETNCCVMMHQHQQHLSGGGPFLKCCEQQAEDRCYRMGQKNPVAVARVVAKDSFEDKILVVQQQKGKSMNALHGLPEAARLARGEMMATMYEARIVTGTCRS